MTILFCGGEEIDFIGTMMQYDSVPTHRRTEYSRTAIQMWNSHTLSSPVLSSPISSAWFTFYFAVSAYFSQDVDRIVFGLRNSSSGSEIGIGKGAAQLNRLAIVKSDGTNYTLLAQDTTFVLVDGECQKIDVQVSNYGSNGTVNFWVAGNLILSYTGNIASNGDTVLDQLFIQSYGYIWFSFSEVILANEDTRSMSLKTLAPNADGDTTDWTGDYTAIDEIILNDLDCISSDIDNELQMINVENSIAGNYVIKAVKISYRAVDSVGDFSLQPGIKISGVNHLESTITLEYGFTNGHVLYSINPETTAVFTPSEIDSMQIIFKSIDLGA